MTENPFDKACRFLLKLEPAAMLAWLLGVVSSAIEFISWIDARRLPFPGNPDRICDTVAHVERLDDNHRPWAVVAEFNIELDALMFGRMLAYLGSLWTEESWLLVVSRCGYLPLEQHVHPYFKQVRFFRIERIVAKFLGK